MGLVANGVSRVPSHLELKSGDFFPAVKLDRIRDEIRLDSSVTDERLRNAVQYAVIHSNGQLKILQEYAATLAELTTDKLNEESVAEILYFQAVSAATAARLVERYRGYDSTAKAEEKSELQGKSADEYRRDWQWAIRDILQLVDGSVRHVTVELI